MAWYCDRCGEKLNSFTTGKYNSKDFDCMEEHSIPPRVNICGCCFHYLFDSTACKRLFDEDRYYLEEPDGEFHKVSRFYKKSREFDIKYKLLNSETNIYWDEDFDDVIEDSKHINVMAGKFITEDDGYEYEDEESSEDEFDEYGTDDNENDKDEEEMLIFNDDANQQILNALHEKSTTAWYKSLKEDAENSYETTFSASFQNFVTRLGLIINDVSNRKFYGKSHYAEILEYICKTIIDDDFIYKNLIKLNTKANASKHSKKNIDVDIDKTLTDYNSLIDKLISVSNCEAFEICHVYKNITKSDVECSCCGRIKPKKYYRCKMCKRIVCDECFNKEKKMCCECANN